MPSLVLVKNTSPSPNLLLNLEKPMNNRTVVSPRHLPHLHVIQVRPEHVSTHALYNTFKLLPFCCDFKVKNGAASGSVKIVNIYVTLRKPHEREKDTLCFVFPGLGGRV